MAFGGAPGGLIHILLDFGISHVITVVLDYYRDALLPRIDDPGRREWLRAILGGTQVLCVLYKLLHPAMANFTGRDSL